MSPVSQRSLRFFMFSLLMAMLALSGCQTAPPKGLSPAQIAVLKQQGFELTEEGWEFGLSGKVLFGSDVDSLNAQSSAIVQRIGKALLDVGIDRVGRRPHRRLGQGSLQPAALRTSCQERKHRAAAGRHA